jgi:ClpP class serine protease
VFANDATAMIGSIGTYIGLYDLSGSAAQKGVRAVVIKSGQYKGAGFPGSEITDDQKAYWQALVDKTQEAFSADVAKGRKLPLEKVNELADGRIHLAADAQVLGLIDGVRSFAAAVDELQQRILPQNSSRRTQAMSVSTELQSQPQGEALVSATYAQLKSGCPGADAAFLCAQLEVAATLEQARENWMAEQSRRLKLAQDAATAAAAAAITANKKPGVQTLGAGTIAVTETTGDPIAAWDEAVAAKVKTGLSKARAIAAVVHENPELHESYLAAFNAARRSR